MKKGFLIFILGLVFTLAGCLNTKSDVNEESSSDNKEGNTTESTEAPKIEILGMASSEDDMNIVRDELVKNGFEVELNLQPDYGSFKAQQDAGNFDVAISGWTTVTGNPDYAVRSLFTTDGDYSIMSDPEIDKLIDKAASETPEEWVETYKAFEEMLVFEKAYIAPLYSPYKTQAINSDILKPNSVRLSKSRSLAWESIEFNDSSRNETDPLILAQPESSLTSLDPIKGNDGSINMLNTNMYVRLVNLTDEDVVTSDGSLSYNHAIADGNSEYYFLLRDDINFAKIDNKKAVDTGELVSADDVVFSLNRAKDPNSVPDHRTYTLHEHIDQVDIVTNIDELKDTEVSGDNGSVLEALEKGVDHQITSLTNDKAEVDNGAGSYQVIKVTTTKPFPQVLNYLAHQSAGIVSKEQVESINTYDVEDYDVNTDIAYGDQQTVTEGNSYDNSIYASGPYIISSKDNYKATFYKNPGYMQNTEFEPKISEVTMRFIQDEDSTLSTLRNGEIYVYYGVPEDKFEVVDKDENLTRNSIESNAVNYLLFNTEGREVSESADLRKAVLYSINQEDFITFNQGNASKVVSPVGPLVDTGNELVADPEKVKEYLQAYFESK